MNPLRNDMGKSTRSENLVLGNRTTRLAPAEDSGMSPREIARAWYKYNFTVRDARGKSRVLSYSQESIGSSFIAQAALPYE